MNFNMNFSLNSNMPFLPTLTIILILMLGTASLQAQQTVVTGNENYHVKVDLIPEQLAAVPGSTLWLALRMDHEARWHTYWINPGDAGLPTEIAWSLPQGVSAGEILWPIPERFDLPADLVDFGYTGEIFPLIPLTIAADYNASTLTLSADVKWYECDEICIPGSASIALDMPVAATAAPNTQWAWAFAQTRQSQPRADISLDANFHFSEGQLNLLVQATEAIFENARSISFIPDTHRVVDYLAAQDITRQQSSLQLRQNQHSRVAREQPARVGGLLLVTDRQGAQIAYQVEASAAQVDVGLYGSLLGQSRSSNLNIGTVFLFALLGGLILNLMPCVFPVLSLKVLSLANSHGAARREQRMHGIAYTGGVMLSFFSLALVLLILQAGGAAIGWGFQLQQPWLVAALVFVFFVMGLSMSGVVEFGTSIMGIGSDLQEKEGLKGSFFTGVLAAVVASPCTAPFMGAALGFAFTQSMPVALTVFLALGFGMALPFLLLSFVPALGRFLPRPGVWMQTFRQVLAFPLYATAVWLLWVIGNQVGNNGVALVLAACILLAFACWLWQKRHHSVGTPRHLKTATVLLSVGLALSVLASPFLQTGNGPGMAIAADANYEAYSAARLAQLRSEGKPVFVNMTAAWCITCLVNEKLALSTDTVVNALADKGVTYLKGDWTNNDPAITEVLRQFETSGVPLYLMYPTDPSRPAEVLPQLLTEGIVLEALERI
jgi:thiol:disulfide interchange protein